MELKVAIIDDEQYNVENLKSILKDYHHNLNIVFTSNTFNEAKEKIDQYQPDLLFLDISLDQRTAFDLLLEIKRYNYIVIFISTDHQYILDCFKFNTAFFISKPITIKEVSTAVHIACSKYYHHNFTSKQEINELIRSTNSQRHLEYLAVSDLKSIRMINYESIMFFKSDGRYTEVHDVKGFFAVATRNIGQYEAILPEELFFRIHKSYIVNINNVKALLTEKNTISCQLVNDLILPVSKRKVSSLLDFIKL